MARRCLNVEGILFGYAAYIFHIMGKYGRRGDSLHDYGEMKIASWKLCDN